MAEGYTDFITDQLNDLVLRAEALSLGATLYVAVFNGGVEADDAVWTNYARLAVTRNATNFSSSSSGDAANAIVFDFGTATVVAGPQDGDEIRVFDDPTAGNLVWQALLLDPKTINDGDPVTIPVADLDFTFSQTA